MKTNNSLRNVLFFSLAFFTGLKSFSQNPDLVVQSVGIYLAPGETTIRPGMIIPRISLLYKNNGSTIPVGSPSLKNMHFRVQLYLSTTAASPFGIKIIPSPYNYVDEMELKLSSGAAAEFTAVDAVSDNIVHTYTFTNVLMPASLGETCKNGSVAFGGIIDVENRVAESNEGNNTFLTSLRTNCTTQPPPPPQNGKPDLIIEDIATSATTVSPGGTLGWIKVRVKNIGTAKAIGTMESSSTGYFVDVILSIDAAATVSLKTLPSPYDFVEDMLLRGGRISNTYSLNPGEVREYVLPDVLMPVHMPLACQHKNVYIGAIADPKNTIAESNETNNTKFLSVGTRCQ